MQTKRGARNVQARVNDGCGRTNALLRIYSLVGVVPTVAFVLFHLGALTRGRRGQQVFTQVFERIDAASHRLVFELLLVVVPIGVQLVIGLMLVSQMRDCQANDRRHWWMQLHGVAALLAALFVGFHVYQVRFQSWLGRVHPRDYFDVLCASLASTWHAIPVVAMLYVVGLMAVCYYLARGMWIFLCSWGLVKTSQSKRVAIWVLGILGVGVWGFGIDVVLYFATGSQLFAVL